MANQLIQDIAKFNSEIFRHEITRAIIIRDQLDVILKHAIYHRSNETNAHHLKVILNAVDESLRHMLTAKNLETFYAHADRLQSIVESTKERCSLIEINTEAKSDFLQFNNLLKAVQANKFESRDSLLDQFDESSLDRDGIGNFQNELKALQESVSPESYIVQKELLLKNLIHFEEENNLGNRASMCLVEENLHQLRQTRELYLIHETHWKRVAKDAAWSAGGAVMIVASSVLVVGFPFLMIPGIVVGAGIMAYAAMDLAKVTREANHSMDLGHRQINEKDLSQLTEIIKDSPAFDVEEMMAHRQKVCEQQEKENKWTKRLGIGTSVLGLVLAITAFATALPFLAVPLAGIVTIASLSILMAGTAVGILAFKARKSQQSVLKVQQETQCKLHEDHENIDALSLKLDVKNIEGSTAKIFHDELEALPAAAAHDLKASISKLKEQSERLNPVVKATNQLVGNLEHSRPDSLTRSSPDSADKVLDEKAQDGEGEQIKGIHLT